MRSSAKSKRSPYGPIGSGGGEAQMPVCQVAVSR